MVEISSYRRMLVGGATKVLLTADLQVAQPNRNQPKWKCSTFCGLSGSTTYPYLPHTMIEGYTPSTPIATLESGIDVGQGIPVGPGNFFKKKA